MEYARSNETLPFAEAIREGRGRIDALPPLARERRSFSYIKRELYSGQVQRVLAHFPRDQVLFLWSEDLHDDHVATLARIAAFLGITSFPDNSPKREQISPEVPLSSVPTEADRALVTDLVRDDMPAFAALTGLDVSGWPTMK
jgi:hypothetical protein